MVDEAGDYVELDLLIVVVKWKCELTVEKR